MEIPTLWNWARVKMTQPNSWRDKTEEEEYKGSLQQLEIVYSCRISIIQDLCLLETNEMKPHMERLLYHLLKLEALTNLKLEVAQNSFVRPNLVAKVVSTVRNVDLSKCCQNRPSDKGWNEPLVSIIEAVWKEIAENDYCTTKALRIDMNRDYVMKDIDPNLFCKCAVKLTKLDICTRLTNAQSNELFKAVAKGSDAQLEHLCLSNTKLNHIDPQIFAEASGKFKSLRVDEADLTAEQIDSLCQDINNNNLNIEELSIKNDFINNSIR